MGRHGLICAANIKTSQGRTNRPISKLIPLEVLPSTGMETDGLNSAPEDGQTVKGLVDKQPQRTTVKRGKLRVMDWVKYRIMGIIRERKFSQIVHFF